MPDEHYMLKHNPIRRFYHNLYSMRAESSITRVASSPVHPSVLIGGADGRVEASNPVGRITNYKIIPWQQTWFAHEWRGPVDRLEVKLSAEDTEMDEGGPVGEVSEAADGDTAQPVESGSGLDMKSVLSQPLLRITEGYKALQPGIQHSVTSKKPANPEVGKGITIYEEQSAITALAWNPNIKFGTWAVAGMGSGLLRVEDIGV
jgi:transcription factor C subunit 6